MAMAHAFSPFFGFGYLSEVNSECVCVCLFLSVSSVSLAHFSLSTRVFKEKKEGSGERDKKQ